MGIFKYDIKYKNKEIDSDGFQKADPLNKINRGELARIIFCCRGDVKTFKPSCVYNHQFCISLKNRPNECDFTNIKIGHVDDSKNNYDYLSIYN